MTKSSLPHDLLACFDPRVIAGELAPTTEGCELLHDLIFHADLEARMIAACHISLSAQGRELLHDLLHDLILVQADSATLQADVATLIIIAYSLALTGEGRKLLHNDILHSADLDVRHTAAKGLALTGEGCELLHDLVLHHADLDARVIAARALPSSPEGRQILHDIFLHADSHTTYIAAGGLAFDPQGLQLLQKAVLTHSDTDIRFAAAAVLPSSPEGHELSHDLLLHADPTTRISVAHGLGLTDEGRELLHDLVLHADTGTRFIAARGLSVSPEGYELLYGLFFHADIGTRFIAASGLACTQRGIEYLMDLALSCANSATEELAVSAICLCSGSIKLFFNACKKTLVWAPKLDWLIAAVASCTAISHPFILARELLRFRCSPLTQIARQLVDDLLKPLYPKVIKLHDEASFRCVVDTYIRPIHVPDDVAKANQSFLKFPYEDAVQRILANILKTEHRIKDCQGHLIDKLIEDRFCLVNNFDKLAEKGRKLNPYSYIMWLAKNYQTAERRRAKKTKSLSSQLYHISMAPSPLQVLADTELMQAIARIFANLPEHERDILQARIVANTSYADIARAAYQFHTKKEFNKYAKQIEREFKAACRNLAQLAKHLR